MGLDHEIVPADRRALYLEAAPNQPVGLGCGIVKGQ
jgi:hypothetical protein